MKQKLSIYKESKNFEALFYNASLELERDAIPYQIDVTLQNADETHGGELFDDSIDSYGHGDVFSDLSNPKSFTPYRATYPWWLGAHVEENETVRFIRSELERYCSSFHCFPFWQNL